MKATSRITMVLLLLSVAATAQEAIDLPEAPQPQRTFDRYFISSMVADVGLMGTDFGMSVAGITNSRNKCVVESNPMFGSEKPSIGEYARVMLPITLGANLASYLLKRYHVRAWALPQTVDGIAHFVGVVSNTHNMENWPCNR
jgi:hypothetical protein